VSGANNLIWRTRIAFNGGSGIVVRSAAAGLTTTEMELYRNAAPQFDLGGDGRTLNDVGDGDTGANNLQNFPVADGYSIQEAFDNSRGVLVRGHLDAAPLTTYEIYLVFGRRGQTSSDLEIVKYPYFGHITNVTTGASGHADFTGLSELVDGVSAFGFVARDLANNQSEISDPMDIEDLVAETGCGACGLEWLIIPALAAWRRRRRATSAP